MSRANNTAWHEVEISIKRSSTKADIPKIKSHTPDLNGDNLRGVVSSFLTERSRKLQKIKQKIAKGTYSVSYHKIAVAILKF